MLAAPRALLALLTAVVVALGVATPGAFAPATATPVITGAVVGTVTGPDGQPIEPIPSTQYAWVALERATTGVRLASVIVDANGSFAFPEVPAGTYTVIVDYVGSQNIVGNWAPGVYSKSQAQVYTVAVGQTLELDLRLEAGAQIQGRITLEGGGTGVIPRLHQIVGQPTDGRGAPRYTVDTPTGQYVIDRLPPGTYGVTLADQYDQHWPVQWPDRWGGIGVATPITLAAGQVRTGIDATLPRIAAIEGALSLPPGAPSSLIFQTLYLRQNGQVIDSETPGASGQFRFAGHIGENFTLCTRQPDRAGYDTRTCWHPEHGISREPMPFSMGRTDRFTEVDLRLETGGLLVFDARPQENGSFAGWFSGEATLYKLDEDDGYWYPTDTAAADTSISFGDRSFTFPAVEPGSYRIQLTQPDYMAWFGRLYYPGTREWAQSETIEIRAFETTDLGTMPITWKTYDVARIAGANRYETGVRISESTEVDVPVPVVYVASGAGYADALSAGPAAAAQGGVLLLTPPTALTDSLRAELRRLQPQRIVVAGGVSTVSRGVELELRTFVDSPSQVVRLGGADRYATSRLIVDDAFGDTRGRVAFIATGQNFPDALAAGPAAAAFDGPVLLVRGSLAALDAPTRTLLDKIQPGAFVIAGGTSTVSSGIESGLRSRYGARADVIRAPGRDRFETATFINTISFGEAENALYASGMGFADALAGGTLAASLEAPLYLVRPNCVPELVRTHLDELGIFRIRILGSTGVLGSGIDAGVLC